MNNIYFQYYSLLIFLVSCAVLIGVSYATAPPPAAQLRSDVRHRDRRTAPRIACELEQADVIASAIVLAAIAAAYFYFTG